MDLDEIEKALTGQDVTGTDALVALGLVVIGVVFYVVVGRLLRRAVGRLPDNVAPGEAFDIGIRLAQFLVIGVFVAWALTVLGANVGLARRCQRPAHRDQHGAQRGRHRDPVPATESAYQDHHRLSRTSLFSRCELGASRLH